MPTNDWVHCTITANLLADTHIGSGTGSADVDALVARDRRGRPVIWATHLEGVLRDVADRMQDQPALALFGRAGGDRQQFVMSSLHTEEKEEVECRVWRSSARAAFDNRAPRDDTLRVVEEVPRNTTFTGTVEIRRDDIDVLRRLLRRTDAIGSGRASNVGNVELKLDDPPERVRTHPVQGKDARLLLLLQNRDPVCISTTATPGNIVPTAPYIPGRTLLGALAGWLESEGDVKSAKLLTSGAISVGDALPLPDGTDARAQLDQIEVCPAPLSLESEKPSGPGGELPWWTHPTQPVVRVDKHLLPEDDANSYKRPEPDLFVCRVGKNAGWSAYRPAQSVRLRNGRPIRKQPDPSLFATEYIAEETAFLAEITGSVEDVDAICAAVEPVLNGTRWLRVGRGGAPVEVARAVRSATLDTIGTAQSPAYLTLTSDLLTRDDNLNWITELDASLVTTIPGWPTGAEATPVVQDHVDVHGFNGTARLWRRPAAGIRRGTVFKVADPSAFATAGWLGERTSEGFGRYRIDEKLPGATSPTAAERSEPTAMADDPAEVIAATTRGWLNGHEALASHAGGKTKAGDRLPSVSQWYDLVAELENDDPQAFDSRRGTLPAAKRPWTSSPAEQVLDMIEHSAEPAAYADMFVRWLCAERRQR